MKAQPPVKQRLSLANKGKGGRGGRGGWGGKVGVGVEEEEEVGAGGVENIERAVQGARADRGSHIHMCNVTHSYVLYDTFVCVM